jgi:hypothetical protein
LLYQEKYTIAGVKKKLSGNSPKNDSVSIETIKRVRKRLKEILKILK